MRYRSENKVLPIHEENLTGFRALHFFSEDTDWSKLDQNIKSVNWDDQLADLDPSETLQNIIDHVIKLCKECVPASKKALPRKHHIPKQNRILMRRTK